MTSGEERCPVFHPNTYFQVGAGRAPARNVISKPFRALQLHFQATCLKEKHDFPLRCVALSGLSSFQSGETQSAPTLPILPPPINKLSPPEVGLKQIALLGTPNGHTPDRRSCQEQQTEAAPPSPSRDRRRNCCDPNAPCLLAAL